jgi:hypothetical protein
MAVRTPPLYLQAGSHTAENDRLGIEALIGGQGVVLAPGYLPQTAATKTGDLAVNQSATPGMSVTVAAGGAYILGTSTSTQGMYFAYNDAQETLVIAAANPSLARIDRISLQVSDSAYAGSTNTAALVVTAGTAAAVPVAPAAPASSITLATVLVGAGVTSILNANITDQRTRAASLDAFHQAAAVGDDSVTIQALVGQTGNLLSVRDATGAVVNGFNSAGTLIGAGGTGGGGSVSDVFLLMGG